MTYSNDGYLDRQRRAVHRRELAEALGQVKEGSDDAKRIRHELKLFDAAHKRSGVDVPSTESLRELGFHSETMLAIWSWQLMCRDEIYDDDYDVLDRFMDLSDERISKGW